MPKVAAGVIRVRILVSDARHAKMNELSNEAFRSWPTRHEKLEVRSTI